MNQRVTKSREIDGTLFWLVVEGRENDERMWAWAYREYEDTPCYYHYGPYDSVEEAIETTAMYVGTYQEVHGPEPFEAEWREIA